MPIALSPAKYNRHRRNRCLVTCCRDPDMSERTLEAYATRIGWVALGGTCAEIEKIESVAGLHPDHVSFTAGPFLFASTYSPCVSKDAGQVYRLIVV